MSSDSVQAVHPTQSSRFHCGSGVNQAHFPCPVSPLPSTASSSQELLMLAGGRKCWLLPCGYCCAGEGGRFAATGQSGAWAATRKDSLNDSVYLSFSSVHL